MTNWKAHDRDIIDQTPDSRGNAGGRCGYSGREYITRFASFDKFSILASETTARSHYESLRWNRTFESEERKHGAVSQHTAALLVLSLPSPSSPPRVENIIDMEFTAISNVLAKVKIWTFYCSLTLLRSSWSWSNFCLDSISTCFSLTSACSTASLVWCRSTWFIH